MGLQGHPQRGMNFTQTPREGKSPIPCEAPTESVLPRVTSNQTPYPRCHDQTFQDNCARFARQSLEEESEDGNVCVGWEEIVEGANAEEHGEGEEPGGDEADGYCAHYGYGDRFFGTSDFFGHVRCAVQACERPVGVY